MCTLSWRKSSTHTLILFNRDESFARGPEGPLKEGTLKGRRIACPKDEDSGGTWIGINDHGCAIALLNHYPKDSIIPSPRKSRGELVLNLLDLPGTRALLDRVKDIDLNPFPPFRLVALDRKAVQQVRWDGSKLHLDSPQPPLGSSSLDDQAIPKERAHRFRKLPDSDEALFDFHRSHLPERGAWSTCMHRSDARSCSFTRILIEENQISIEHHHRPPCEVTSGFGDSISLKTSPTLP